MFVSGRQQVQRGTLLYGPFIQLIKQSVQNILPVQVSWSIQNFVRNFRGWMSSNIEIYLIISSAVLHTKTHIGIFIQSNTMRKHHKHINIFIQGVTGQTARAGYFACLICKVRGGTCYRGMANFMCLSATMMYVEQQQSIG